MAHRGSQDNQQQEPYDTYYHYTDKRGAKGIRQSKTIIASDASTTRDDTAFGDGTYLTKLNPYHNTKHDIAKNNYDTSEDFYRHQVDQGKTDYVVKVKIPHSEAPVQCVDPNAPDRSLFLFQDDIDLNRYSAKVEKVKHNRNN